MQKVEAIALFIPIQAIAFFIPQKSDRTPQSLVEFGLTIGTCPQPLILF
ncbi:hypothetical protein [Argonema antarcticum]|nr:hypothetical protein [Argonema antarcticum]MCL1474995.1 hypothetical protein [Argonema antarcticum A004/B2]